ncbi:MAG TPA: Mu-like prophage major head subunit gpT family protein [Tepidisphaeraceae bacterium]
MRKPRPTEMQITGSATIQAMPTPDVDPTIQIVAYRGGPMRPNTNPPLMFPVIVDLAGLQTSPQTLLLTDHDTTTNGVVGVARVEVRGKEVHAAGTLSRAATGYERVVGLHRSGITFQASIGTTIDELDFIPAGKAGTVNGAKAAGPVYIVRKSKLKEISITPFGADGSSSVRIAARKVAMAKKIKHVAVAEVETPEPEAEGVGNDAVLAAVEAERGRLTVLATLCANHPNILTKAMADDWSQAKVKAEVKAADLQASLSGPHINAGNGGTTSGRRGRSTPIATPTAMLTAALMLHAGRPDDAVKTFGEQTTQRAEDMRCRSMMDLCAAALRLDCEDVPYDSGAMIRAAFSTLSLPMALGNLAEKTTADAFNETPGVYGRIARVRNVANFKEQKIIRVLLTGSFEDLAPDGEIKHTTLSESSNGIQLGTKALMLGLTRQDIINDDLGVFNDVSNALGRAAKRRMNDDFANLILRNAGSFFSSDHGNYAEGVDTALSAASLQAGMTSMSKRQNAAGHLIDVRAKFLLVPPELEYTARQIITSAEVMRYTSASKDNQPTGNPQQDALEIVVEPRLSSAGYTGNSVTSWYLFSSPGDSAINLALLNGRTEPVIENADTAFNTLGIQFRGYHDYGFSLSEPLAAYKAKGAA